jgi:hypothetical protein
VSWELRSNPDMRVQFGQVDRAAGRIYVFEAEAVLAFRETGGCER